MRIVCNSRTGAKQGLRRLTAPLAVTLACAGLALWPYYLLRDARRRAQLQEDPRVATVWIAGVTQGANQTLTRGTALQKWLNGIGITCFGEYRSLQSRFSGDPGSLEIWFDYRSHLQNKPDLECSRSTYWYSVNGHNSVSYSLFKIKVGYCKNLFEYSQNFMKQA